MHEIPLSFLPNSGTKTILFDFSEWQNLYSYFPKGTEKAFDKLKRIVKKQKKYKLVHIPTWGYTISKTILNRGTLRFLLSWESVPTLPSYTIAGITIYDGVLTNEQMKYITTVR